MRRLLWVGLLLLSCSGQLWAAEQTEQLDDVVVTATRTSTDLAHIGGTSLTVITAADIEARHLTSVVDVLNTVPGLQVSNVGGLGAVSKVSIRGAHTKDTLLLIDGIVANDTSDPNRGADFSNITLDNVERIEVVRGAMSVLYGSNATAGVINIITKSGAEQTHGYVGGEAGTYNTYKAYGGLNGSLGISDFSLSLSRLTSDGYSLANADNNYISHAGNTSEEDGWENTTFSGKVTVDLCSNASLTAVLRTVDSTMDLDDEYFSYFAGGGYATDRTLYWGAVLDPTGRKDYHIDTARLFGKLNLHSQLLDGKFVSDLDYKHTRQERDAENNDGDDYYDYLGETDEWSWQGTWQVSSIDYLTAGFNYTTESMDSSSTDKQDATTKSYWIQNQLIVAGVDMVGGVRYDDHDRFGGKTTWRLAPAYHFVKTGTTLRASYATGFRAPSLSELYGQWGANENLEPEKNKSLDIGIDQQFMQGVLRCGLTYFKMKFEDRITYESSYVQVAGDSKNQGIELYSKWQIVEPILISVDYTYTDTEDSDGQRFVRIPLNKVHAGISYAFSPSGNINLDGYWVSERDTISSARDAQLNSVASMDDYFLVNLAAHYDVTDMLRIYARIDNLFDEHYEEAWSYATPGQSFYAGAKLTF